MTTTSDPVGARSVSLIGEFVPEAVEDTYADCYPPDPADPDLPSAAAMFAAAIDWCFNPADDDGAQEAILCNAVIAAARFIESLPCTCTEDDFCERCLALGRDHDVRQDR